MWSIVCEVQGLLTAGSVKNKNRSGVFFVGKIKVLNLWKNIFASFLWSFIDGEILTSCHNCQDPRLVCSRYWLTFHVEPSSGQNLNFSNKFMTQKTTTNITMALPTGSAFRSSSSSSSSWRLLQASLQFCFSSVVSSFIAETRHRWQRYIQVTGQGRQVLD